MNTKRIVCLSCPTTEGTDQNNQSITVWQEWDIDDLENIYQHQQDYPDHILIKGYKG